MNKKLELTDAQYLAAMNNLRDQVQHYGLKLSGFDDNAVGDKDTQCTWGLCGENPKVYPTADFYLFPDQLPGRLAHKYYHPSHHCPFEDPKGKDQLSGCFYRCRFFQNGERPSKGDWLVYWKEAVAWHMLDKTLPKKKGQHD